MQISQTQQLRQKQQLIMTPKLQQAIKILLMSRLELEQHVAQEMEENPLLEQISETEEDVDADDVKEEEEMEAGELDISWEDLYDDSSSIRAPTEREYIDDNDRPSYYYNVVLRDTLQDHLMVQLGMAPFVEIEFQIGEEIVGNINDDGFLTVEPEEIAQDLNCKLSKVKKVLYYIQHEFDPTGISTKDTQECLLIQLESMYLNDTLARKIIKDHYKEFINNRLPQIAKSLDVDVSDIQKEREIIKTLNPLPGSRFNQGNPNHRIIPDVEVRKIDDEYKVITKNDGMPRLMLSRYYINLMQNSDSLKSDTKDWLEARKRKAIELLKMIDQRQNTIKNITQSIFEVQEDFLEKGIKGLKPLTLRDIADMAEVHESTVSRVTTNKYVQTSQGVYELKFFFTGGLERDWGSDISTLRVKQMVRRIIDEEDPAKPLSDRIISNKLKDNGIHIERRTVAKYRKKMNILSSTKRKRKWK